MDSMTPNPDVPNQAQARLDSFVDEVRELARRPGAAPEVRAAMCRLVAHVDGGPAPLADLPRSDELDESPAGPLGADIALFEDDTVSIMIVDTVAGVDQPPHDHQLDTIIGVFEGTEAHRFYARTASVAALSTTAARPETALAAIEPAGTRALHAGQVLTLGPDDIHAISTPGPTRCRAVHVYLGRLSTVTRSLFHPETFAEEPLVVSQYTAYCRAT